MPLALCCAIAAFFLLTNRNIPFANGPNCDTWHFFGRFYLADQLPALATTREGSRPPEFIIGYLFARVLHGVSVEYANFVVFFVTGAFAVYNAARRLFGVWPAIVAVIFFATQPLVMSNYAATYTEGSVTYSAIAIAFAINAAFMRRSLRRAAVLLAAGFFWGSAVHAHLFSITMNFIVALYCLDWSVRPSFRWLTEAMQKWLVLLAGALLATAFFGVVNALVLHGSFWFFWKQFADLGVVLILPYQKSNWYLLGGRGALLLVGAVACLAQGVRLRRGQVGVAEATAVLTALVPFAVLEIAQLIYTLFDHGLALQYDYYFVWLIAPLALMIASLPKLGIVNARTAAAIMFAYLVASLLGNFGRLDLSWQKWTSFPPSLAIAIIGLPVVVWLLRKRAGALAMFALLAALDATIRPEKIGLPVWQAWNERDVYTRVDEGMDFLSRYHFEELPKFWVDARSDRWETLAYPRSYNYCPIDSFLPAFASAKVPDYDPKTETFSHGDDLVLIPRDSIELQEALKNLSARGTPFQELRRKSISYRGVSYLIVVGRLR